MIGTPQLPQAQPLRNVLGQRAGPMPPAQPQPMPVPGAPSVGTAMQPQNFRMGMPLQAQPVLQRPGMLPQGTAMPAQPMQQWQQPPAQNALMQRARGFY